MSGLPLHLVDFNHLLTIPDSLSGLVAHFSSGYGPGLRYFDFADSFFLVSHSLGLPAGHVVALESKDLGRGNLNWLGVA